MEAHLREILGDPLTLAFTLLRVAVVYLVLLLFLRLSGKKVLGQMTPLDLLTLLLLSNVVQNAMIGPDNSLLGGLLGAGLLLLLDRVLSRSRLRRSFMGEPVLLVHEGRPVWDHLRREGVELEELMAALREHGVARLEDVLEAVLEVDGTISVVPKDHLEPKRVRKVRSSRNR
ncbi:MAG: YetF domain-containing protein [Thermus sp.]|uniref:YetF domain-containing protein n=1 Tax=Thermus TaxID=270 RepID=UPI001FAB07A1|nr:YetF domain-containing protein [Thermus thalpophilus]